MLGTLINSALILVGSALGLLLRKGLPERIKHALMSGMGLATILIGLSGALKTADTLCVIICMGVGGLIGSALDLEKQLDRLGKFAERKLAPVGGEKGSISTGFVSASLVYCVGAMAIVGSISAGLRHDYSTLIAKGIIDGIVSIVFTSTMGIGVALSAISVFVYQGAITLASGLLEPVLSEVMITEMSAVGGMLIAAIGLNMLYDRRIPVGNLLPAVFMPMAYLPLRALIG